MAATIKSILNKTDEYFRKTDRKKVLLLVVSAAVIIAAGIIGTILLNRIDYAVLYSGLSAEEAGTIENLLSEMDVQVKAKGTDTILVPADEADDIRIQLAAQGYPNTGLNYDIFSNSSALGSTDLERQTYLQYQLQENMRATLCKMDKVKDCIVIVSLASSSSFVLSSNASEASVAVMLELTDGETLTGTEAKSIGEFVAKCVPGLDYENISIVDSEMNYYDITADGNDAEDVGGYSTAQQELTERTKKILSDQVTSVLAPAVGTNNIAVSVNLVLDFDKETTSTVAFSTPSEDEDKGIVRSSEVDHELTTDGSGTSAATGEAGTDSNGVSASEYVYDGNADGLISESSSETYNYEINEVRTDIEKAQGSIQDLSVSVLINSDVEGISDHQDSIRNIVANAIGVDPEYITVELMPFVQSSGGSTFDDYMSQSEQNLHDYNMGRLIRLGIIAGALLLTALVVILVLKRRKKKKEAASAPKNNAETIKVQAEKPASSSFVENTEAGSMLGELIMQKSSETEVVEELMDRYPETVVQILRSWLAED